MANIEEDVKKLVLADLQPKFDDISKKLEMLTADREVKPADGVRPYHKGHFEIEKVAEDKQEVYCPSCGTFERIPIQEHVVEKIEEKIPEDYMPKPKSLEQIIPLLELPHENGQSIYDCPNCSKQLVGYMTKHKDDLKKIGFDLQPFKKK